MPVEAEDIMKTLALAAIVACSASWSAAWTTPGGATSTDASEVREAWKNYRTTALKDLDAFGAKIDALEARSQAEGARMHDTIRAEVKSLRAKIDRSIGEIKTVCRKDAARASR
jgi:hypothetical protein